jgi:hypothetical protein
VTNGERADRLVGEARQIAGEMNRALDVDYPKTHDPAPVFAQAVRMRGIGVDVGVLDSLMTLSQELVPARRARSPARGGLAQAVAEGAVEG